MVKAGYGRIVNIASVAGKEGNPNAAAYAAAKGGLIAFTKALGKELAQTGVLVNCVTPAAAQTAILEQVTPEFAKFMLSKIPMGRFVKVEEIAAMACWLASEDCSFSTGGVFFTNSGSRHDISGMVQTGPVKLPFFRNLLFLVYRLSAEDPSYFAKKRIRQLLLACPLPRIEFNDLWTVFRRTAQSVQRHVLDGGLSDSPLTIDGDDEAIFSLP